MNISSDELKKYLIEILRNNKDQDEEKLSQDLDELFIKIFTNTLDTSENDELNEIPDELKNMIKEMFDNSSSIDYAIKARKEEIEIIKASFNATKKNYKTASFSRHINVFNLKILKLSVKLYKLKLLFLQDEGYKLYQEYEDKIKESIDEIYNLKSLLKLIRIAIKKLERIDEILCLKEINDLIYSIIIKQGIICDYIESLSSKYAIRYEGINVSSNDKYEKQLEEVDDNILKSIKMLNLH